MPDISMCPGGDCPLKETCYRYTANPNPHRQSYFVDPPWDGEKCRHYWKLESKSQVRRVNIQRGLDQDGGEK